MAISRFTTPCLVSHIVFLLPLKTYLSTFARENEMKLQTTQVIIRDISELCIICLKLRRQRYVKLVIPTLLFLICLKLRKIAEVGYGNYNWIHLSAQYLYRTRSFQPLDNCITLNYQNKRNLILNGDIVTAKSRVACDSFVPPQDGREHLSGCRSFRANNRTFNTITYYLLCHYCCGRGSLIEHFP